jgi:NAD kinase
VRAVEKWDLSSAQNCFCLFPSLVFLVMKNLGYVLFGRMLFSILKMLCNTVHRSEYTQGNVDWADVIIPTGGDGTYLMAASRVSGNEKPVIGLNSDPSRSEGYLCLPVKYSTNIKEAIHKLLKVCIDWAMICASGTL